MLVFVGDVMTRLNGGSSIANTKHCHNLVNATCANGETLSLHIIQFVQAVHFQKKHSVK